MKARHKRTDLFHVVVIPRLMTPRWRRLFNKACDFLFIVSPGPSFVLTPMGWDRSSFLTLQALVSQASPIAGGNGKGPACSARYE